MTSTLDLMCPEGHFFRGADSSGTKVCAVGGDGDDDCYSCRGNSVKRTIARSLTVHSALCLSK